MLRIKCPFCGERDHADFTYGGDASIEYPELDGTLEDWHQAVFLRDNIRGVQSESWHHALGCRMWLIVGRDTVSHEILSVRAAHKGYAKILEKEKEKEQRESGK